VAVDSEGKREIVGLHIGPSEAETFWATFLRSLVKRGLRGTKLVISDQRYRTGKPISTSRAEGTVNQLVSARMNKRRQMRWSPRGAHRVLQVRAAVLDGRFGHQAIPLAA